MHHLHPHDPHDPLPLAHCLAQHQTQRHLWENNRPCTAAWAMTSFGLVSGFEYQGNSPPSICPCKTEHPFHPLYEACIVVPHKNFWIPALCICSLHPVIVPHSGYSSLNTAPNDMKLLSLERGRSYPQYYVIIIWIESFLACVYSKWSISHGDLNGHICWGNNGPWCVWVHYELWYWLIHHFFESSTPRW